MRVCAAIIRNGAILMVQHEEARRVFWTLPGGKVEDGETPEQAVRREVQEETGLYVAVTRALFERLMRITSEPEVCFLGEILGDQEPSLGYDPELAASAQVLKAVAWFQIDNVRDDIQVSMVIEALKETA
jgi:ADP-ribose pyrophosphatase YjhB (NUDIX family)